MTKRPALTGAFAVIAGIIAAKLSGFEWYVSALFSAFLFCAALGNVLLRRSLQGRESYPSLLFLAALFFSAAASYSVSVQLQDHRHISRFLTISDSLTFRCRVLDEPHVAAEKTKLLVEILSVANDIDTVETEGKAYVTIYPDRRKNETPVKILYGSEITFASILQVPSAERNPGEFSYKEYLALNNICATVSVRGYANVSILEERITNPLFEYIIFPSKAFVITTIRTVMRGDEANFLIGLLLGDRTEISDEIKTAFMNTGTIHVLAVSGSHVVLVAEIIVVVVGLLRFSRKPKIILVMMMLIYYMYLTGATPSVVRATIMMLVMYLGKLFEERTDVYNVLGVSAIVILLFEPKQLFDVGFQLSFSAVFSIVYFYPKLNELIPKIPEPLEEFKIMNTVWQLFAVSLAAQIGTLPFTAFYFGKVSIVSLFANLVVVPLVGVVVTIGLSGAILGSISMVFASCFSEVNELIAVVTLNFVKWAEQVPYAIVHTATFGIQETIIYSLIIGVWFNIGNRVIVKRFVFILLVTANVLLYASVFDNAEKNLRITFLDVGQGDGTVIQFPTGETILIDAGPYSPGYDAGERNVAPFLRRNGISEIHAVITTHPHADHLGGVPYILKNFTVRQTIDAGQQTFSRLFELYDSLVHNSTHTAVQAGTVMSFGDVKMYILHPTPRFIDTDSSNGYSDLNGSSVVFKLQYGSISMIFTGDAETEAEEHIVRVYGDFLRADLLKAGHHGSSTSSSEGFISYVMPAHSVISVAQFNKFRHPSKRVIERLIAAGSQVYRTDQDGAVVFETNGTILKKVQWRE
ncbi:MAG: DNA internalization-related competence protein ComEC/Rec2 [Bacteriovoracaceae bacterium]|nr:DNA internalization-related competence protein ComEC/Rec2 [Bacteroidota bacterium]